MNILCIGGGPAGLYFALLMKQQNPAHRVTVVERNRPFDTFGWGVVLSDQTLANLQAADAPTAALIGDAFNHWDDIEVFFKGRSVRSGGHGFCGIGRKRLLNILQERCMALGVNLVFETDVADDQALAAQYRADLVIASDGLNSRIRTRYADTFQPDIDTRQCRFVWLGTKKTFDAFTFAFEQTEHGWFQAHAYQFDADTSTFIVETPEHEEYFLGEGLMTDARNAVAKAIAQTQAQGLPAGFSDHFFDVPLAVQVELDQQPLGEALIVLSQDERVTLLEFTDFGDSKVPAAIRDTWQAVLESGVALGACTQSCPQQLVSVHYNLENSLLSIITQNVEHANDAPRFYQQPEGGSRGLIINNQLNRMIQDKIRKRRKIKLKSISFPLWIILLITTLLLLMLAGYVIISKLP